MPIKIISLHLIPIMLCSVISHGQTKKDDFIGHFDGRTPCQEIARQIKEPTIPECWKIKWRLTLYKNGNDSLSGTYTLEGFNFRGNNILKGTWNFVKGTATDPNAMVYELYHPVHKDIRFLKADVNVLFFLDENKRILPGNKDFSYILYRAVE